MKSRREERKNRLEKGSKSREKEFKYLSQFEYPNAVLKEKAEDLFLQRKNMFLTNLKKREKKHLERRENEKSRSRSNQKVLGSKDKSKEISPRAKEVSERLYSRSR